MVSPGKPVRAGAIASKPCRPRERRTRRRAGGRVFSPCQQDGRWAKPRRAFSKLVLAVRLIKCITVRHLILAVCGPGKGEIRKGILATEETGKEEEPGDGPSGRKVPPSPRPSPPGEGEMDGALGSCSP